MGFVVNYPPATSVTVNDDGTQVVVVPGDAAAVQADNAKDAALAAQASAQASASSAASSAAAASASQSSASGSATSASNSAAAAAVSQSAAAASASSAATSAASIDSYASLPVEFRQFAADGSVLSNLPARVHPAEQLLKQAVWWIDAAHSSASGQSVSNLGWGGSALDARVGSTGSADSNDPKYLDWQGENYIYLPGVSGNYLSVPDEAALDITGDIDIRVKVAPTRWDGRTVGLLAKRGTTSGTTMAYQLTVLSNGVLDMSWVENDGVTIKDASSSARVPESFDGSDLWVRATLDVDNGDATPQYEVVFWYSENGVSWTQLGVTRVGTTGVTSIQSNSADVRIGTVATFSTAIFDGKIHRAQILNGIDGTPVLDVDCSQITSGADTSFTALTGQTVTINRSTSGRKTVGVVHPRWLFGTDDYMEVPARWVDASSGGLFLPGVASNYASTPGSAALDITGDIDIRVRVAMDDWTPAAISWLVSKNVSGGNSYYMTVNATGNLVLWWSPDGTALLGQASTVPVSAVNGSSLWVRATLDVDNGAGGHAVKFYTSDDGVTWTQLGSTVTTAGTTSIYAGTAPLGIGASAFGSSPAAATVHRVQILNGIDGTVVFDADFTGQAALATTFTEDSTNSATVTVNTSGSGYVATLVPASGYVQPTGVANYQPSSYSLLDFGASDSFTVLAVLRQWDSPSFARIISKEVSGTGVEWYLRNRDNDEYDASVIDGTTTVERRYAWLSDDLNVLSMVVDRSANTLQLVDVAGSSPTSSIATVGSLVNSNNLRIGSFSGGGFYNDMEFIAAAIWRRSLTAGEIATLNSYYQGRG